MGDGYFERNLKRILGAAARPVEANPLFREQLRRRLQAEAEGLRAGEPARPEPVLQVYEAPRFSPWRVAAAAVLLIAVATGGVWLLRGGASGEKPGRLVCLSAPEPLRLAANRPIVMEIARGREGAVSLEDRGAELARLELKDGAEVELKPGDVPVLSLRDGVVRVEARQAVRVRAAHVDLAVGAGADVEIERINHTDDRTGDSSMNKSWLIPGGLVLAAGATAVAILVHQGNVEVKAPETRPAVMVAEKPMIIEAPTTRRAAEDDRDKKLAEAQRKIAELEKKLAASKKESDKLASDLVKKKGVTIDNVATRLAELRKGTTMSIMLPGKTAELVADIKGLGQAGVQALLDLLKSEDAKDRFMAAKLLEDLKDPAAIPALREVALNDADAMASNMAGHALALMEDPRAIDTLREIAAKNRSWQSEVNSLWGLVHLGDQQGVEQATAYMNDKKVDDSARAALGANIAALMTDRPDVMPIVDATVRDFYMSAQVMDLAITYYRQLATPDARIRLQAIVDDSRVSQAIRDKAREALQH